MKAIKRAIAIAICCMFGIAFGQSSEGKITSIERINIGFGNNQSTTFATLTHDSAGNYFVSGSGGGYGAEIAKYATNGQRIWETGWGANDSSSESIQNQMYYEQADNSVVAATIEEQGTRPELVAKFDANDGHQIWQVQMSAIALGSWGGYTLALQENASSGTIFLINNADGSIRNSFSISGYLSFCPMIKTLGDTVWVFANQFFAKYLLPSGQLLWKVSTTDFATRSVITYGAVDTKGCVYIGVSDWWNQMTGAMFFAAAKYSNNGQKIWSKEWYGWSDTSLAGGFSSYNLNNWIYGIAVDESVNVVSIFGGTQKYGTIGSQTDVQSAYLALLDAGNGDTIVTTKWDDGSSIETGWNDGYFNPENQLVLLGLGVAAGDTLVADNFIEVFDVTGINAVTKQPSRPTAFTLSQNYPNPFNPTTTISFTLGSSSNVRLEVYNLLGQKVATVVNGFLFAGSHTYQFDASKLASGVYIYRLEAGSFTKTMKMVLMK